MVRSTIVRKLALALPEATEEDHHGAPSFRVAGRIFATLPDEDHLHVMLDEAEIREAVRAHPGVCEEKWWGARLAAVRVTLAEIPEGLLKVLLFDAWERVHPDE